MCAIRQCEPRGSRGGKGNSAYIRVQSQSWTRAETIIATERREGQGMATMCPWARRHCFSARAEP